MLEQEHQLVLEYDSSDVEAVQSCAGALETRSQSRLDLMKVGLQTDASDCHRAGNVAHTTT